MSRWLAAVVGATLLLGTSAGAALSSADLAGIGARPPAGAHLPDLSYVDQHGAAYDLAPSKTPTILLFADYSCRHICGPGITLTAGALHDAGLVPERDYRMVAIGLDQDGPAVARKLIAERLQGLDAEQRTIILLTGTPAVLAAAEQALGYHAAYDPQADQFAHDASIYVFDKTGRLTSLLPEIGATPSQLKAAIDGRPTVTPAPAAEPGSGIVEHVAALCYGLASAHGVYAAPIVLALRVGGVLICVGLAGFVVWSLRRRHREAV